MTVLGTLLLLTGMAPVPKDEYDFVLDLNRAVVMYHGPNVSIGKLDERGSFIPDAQWANVDPAVLPSSTPKSCWLNPPKKVGRPETVYEFRSDRLIPGELDEEGHFVPEIGGKIVRFKDYKYEPNKSRPIYNLPGKFVRKN